MGTKYITLVDDLGNLFLLRLVFGVALFDNESEFQLLHLEFAHIVFEGLVFSFLLFHLDFIVVRLLLGHTQLVLGRSKGGIFRLNLVLKL